MSERYQLKYYHPNGKILTTDEKEFIEYYNTRYFTACTDQVKYKTDRGGERSVGKNSKFAEDIIEKLLKKEPNSFTNSDIALILAWKIGKITHTRTQSQNKIVFHRDWQEALGEYSEFDGFGKWNERPIKRYCNKSSIEIDIKSIAEYLRNNGQRLNDLVETDDLKTALEELRRQCWQGIGTVYLITLLYFSTNHQHPGKCPIYDRFAMRALLAIKNGTQIGDAVECGELPDKNCKKWTKIAEDKMKNYVCLLEEIFGDEYKYSRDIDRALWVYGHLFKDSAKGKVTC